MSPAVHIVSGRAMAAQPALFSIVQDIAAEGGDLIVSVGHRCAGASVNIPMPAGRPGLAASVMRKWSTSRQARCTLVAWDADALAVAAESSSRVVAVLDGFPWGGSICARTQRILQQQQIPLLATSKAQAHRARWSGGVLVAAPCLPIKNDDFDRSGFEGRFVVVDSPSGCGTMRPMLNLCGRVRLMGHSVDLLVSGDPRDANEVIGQLEQFDLDRVTRCRACDVDALIGRRACVYFASGYPAGTAPVAAVLKYWLAGATVLLPAGHPAGEWAHGLGGMIENADRDIDQAVRGALTAQGNHVDRSEAASAMATHFREQFHALLHRVSHT